MHLSPETAPIAVSQSAPNRSTGSARYSASTIEVDVWPFDMDQAVAASMADVMRPLSSDERARAMRYRFERDRRRYIAGRSAMRHVLARYTASSPRSLAFAYGPQGKPSLAEYPSVRFNIAHSEGMAILVVTRDREIGVDIEVVREGFAEDRIAEHFFSPDEVEVLRGLPSAEQEQAFFECWTRKEAFLKAKGGGLSLPLDSFAVTFGRSRPPDLIRSELDPSDMIRWTIADLSDCVRGSVAAFAVDSQRVLPCITIRRDTLNLS